MNLKLDSKSIVIHKNTKLAKQSTSNRSACKQKTNEQTIKQNITIFFIKRSHSNLHKLFGAIGHEQFDHARVTFRLRHRQRRMTIVHLRVDIGAILKQQCCNKNVAFNWRERN